MTRNIVCKLVGHKSSLIKVLVLTTPEELVISTDTEGSIKLWKIDENLSAPISPFQTINLTESQQVYCATSAFNMGIRCDVLYMLLVVGNTSSSIYIYIGCSMIAVLAGRLRYFESQRDLSDAAILSGGFGSRSLGAGNNVLWAVSRKYVKVR